jgi:cobalt-zinc-cadmium efflux system membrane fusion protein
MGIGQGGIRPKLVGGLIVAVALIVGALVFFSSNPKSDDGKSTGQARRTAERDVARNSVMLTEKQQALIRVAPAQVHGFIPRKTAVGTIGFNENLLVQVFSQYTGKVVGARFNVGDDVKAGDVLFTIESTDLVQAESSLLASAGVLELQKRNLSRVTGLFKTGGSAQRDIDQATSDTQTAEGNYKAARNAVRIFGKSDEDIDRIIDARNINAILTVTSPIDGRVVSRSAAPGLLVQAGGTPAPYVIADVSTMWMVANVIETDAPAYKIGQPVQATVPAYPAQTFSGTINDLGPSIDSTTHRQLVRSVISDPEHRLRAGMYASFVTDVGPPVNSVGIPPSGLVREGDGTTSLWVKTGDHTFERRSVRTGIQQANFVQLLDGVAPGENIVVDGAVYLSNKWALENGS